MRFAFVTRHSATPEQFNLAHELGISLVQVGDMDAFSVTPEDIKAFGDFEGVVVVHPAMALRLVGAYQVAVFENGARSVEGEKPQFYAKRLHLFPMG